MPHQLMEHLDGCFFLPAPPGRVFDEVTLAYFGNGDVCLAYAASWVGLEVRCEMEVKWVHHETRVFVGVPDMPNRF